MGYSAETPAAIPLDRFFSQFRRSDFHLVKNYTVIFSIENPYNKWPRAFGSAVFLDSKYMLANLIDMSYANAINMLTRNNY